MANKLALVAIASLLLLSTVSVAASADTVDNSHQSMQQLGNFYFSDNATTSSVYNVTYHNDNRNAMVINSAITSGANASGLPVMQGADGNVLNLDNVTMATGGSENMLLFATTDASLHTASKMDFNMTANVSRVNLQNYGNMKLGDKSSELLSTFLSSPVYKVSANGSSFLVFSNAQSVTATGNMLNYSGVAPLQPALIVGVMPMNALKDKLQNEIHFEQNQKLSYNNTTGLVSGMFLNFTFNSTTGAIMNFNDVMANATVFNSISASGNGTIGSSFPGSMIPQAVVAGNVFFYGNNTAVYQVHNNPSMVSNFFVSNGTMNFTLPTGVNATVYNPPRTDDAHASLSANSSALTNVSMGDQYDVQSQGSIVFLQNSSFNAELFVHGANVTLNGSRISVRTNGTAHMTFLAPPGIQKMKKDFREHLQYGIDHGKLAALVTISDLQNGSSNLSMSYNSTMHLSIDKVLKNSITMSVGSSVHHGTDFAIFVPNKIINATSSLKVKFDGHLATYGGNLSQAFNASTQSNTTATYYTAHVNGGSIVVIHVPHFSNHTIQVYSSTGSNGGSPLNNIFSGSNLLYIAIGVVVVAIFGSVAAVARRKK